MSRLAEQEVNEGTDSVSIDFFSVAFVHHSTFLKCGRDVDITIFMQRLRIHMSNLKETYLVASMLLEVADFAMIKLVLPEPSTFCNFFDVGHPRLQHRICQDTAHVLEVMAGS